MFEEKICLECQQTLPFEKFKKSRSGDKVYRSKVCMKCLNAAKREYRKEWLKNKLKEDPDYKKYKHKYLKSEKGINKTKEYSSLNKEKIKEVSDSWYQNNKVRKHAKGKEWIKNNPDKYKENYTKRNRQRQLDPLLNLSMRLRCSVKKSFRKTFLIKRERTFNLLGYSNIDLHNHLFVFLDKDCQVCNNVIVKLDNSNIDHIVPVCVASSETDIINLNQLSNLRLICKSCNANKISQDLKTKAEYNERLELSSSQDRKSREASACRSA